VYIRVVVPNFQTDPYSTYNKDVERVIRHGPVGLCFWFGGPVSGLYGRCDFDFFFGIYIYIDVDYCIHHNNAIHATIFSRYLWDVYAMGRTLGKSPLQENVIVGDLARMVGVYGKSQEAGFKIGSCW